MRKRFLCLLLGLLCLTALLPARGRAADAADVRAIADGIVAWKKADNGATADGFLLNDAFLALAGTTPGDWYPIGLSRLGVEDRYDAYLAVLRDQVEERYRQPGALSAAKATEWHRIALAVLAAGGDPTSFGTDGDGQPIDLIADGTYNRGRQTSLGRQGINGWIWGLIALDSMRYELPDDAFYTREDILLEILCRQLADGGFALSGTAADPDITAMAVQALAPYYNTETVYTYKRKSTDGECARRIRDVVDEALDCLSRLQLPTGDFQSWGTENVESTDQVVVALCCLGIDPLTDERFIKGGNTLLDGILRYRMDDGGFVHAYSYDPDNPTSLPDRSNSMAGEQTLYTMAALWRQSAGLRTLYDFRPEQSESLKARIAALEAGIAALPDDASAASLEALLRDFYALPADERSYVRGYWRLSDAAAAAGLDVSRIADTTPVVEGPDDAQDDIVLLYFSDSDRAAVDALPDVLTTEQYVTVTALLDKLRQCEDFDGREAYLERLNEARSQIAAVQAEIDAINDEIREKLYPFEDVTLLDKPVVDALVARYDALSAYDKTKIERWEDVVKTQTKLDNLLRAIWIGAALCVAAAALALLLVRRVRRRRRRKAEEMEALAALYADEDDRTEEADEMKKDILALFALVLVIAVIAGGTNVQSVDEYYLTHIDDITPESETVFISIRCDTILDNYDELDPALQSEEFVPPDGVILPPTEYVLRPGDTVFDILDRAVRYNRIQMEYQGADKNSFGSVYVQGIHYLYEFSCGPLSGWMYRVDGEFPNYGCSKYELRDGQVIEWVYTCALGSDVGCVWMGGDSP